MIPSLKQTTLPPNLAGYAYSPILCYVGSSIQKIHKIWQHYNHSNKFADPDNWLGLAIGHLADHSSKNKPLLALLLRAVAAPFLVTARFLDLFEQEDRLVESIKSWKCAWNCTKPIIYTRPIAPPSRLNFFISRYRITHWKQTYSNLVIRTQRLFHATIDVLCQTFSLVMRLMDLLELFTLDQKQIRNNLRKAVQEGGVNVPRVLSALSNNKETFLIRLEKIETTIERLLHSKRAKDQTAGNLVTISKKVFDSLESLLHCYKATSKGSGKAAVTLFKGVTYSLTPSFGKKYMRDNFFDPRAPNCLNVIHYNTPIYPNKETITIKLNTATSEVKATEIASKLTPEYTLDDNLICEDVQPHATAAIAGV